MFLERSCAVSMIKNIKNTEVFEFFMLLYKNNKLKSTQTHLAVNGAILIILQYTFFLFLLGVLSVSTWKENVELR